MPTELPGPQYYIYIYVCILYIHVCIFIYIYIYISVVHWQKPRCSQSRVKKCSWKQENLISFDIAPQATVVALQTDFGSKAI